MAFQRAPSSDGIVNEAGASPFPSFGPRTFTRPPSRHLANSSPRSSAKWRRTPSAEPSVVSPALAAPGSLETMPATTPVTVITLPLYLKPTSTSLASQSA